MNALQMTIINKVDDIYISSTLATHDPYDIWKTRCGFWVKKFYSRHKYLGLPFAGLLTLFDVYLNNNIRWGYEKQEYPIVRAMAAMVLMNMRFIRGQSFEVKYLTFVDMHLKWLLENQQTTINGGAGWGIGFNWAVSKDVTYGKDAPLTTVTPYVLEAFCQRNEIEQSVDVTAVIHSIFNFFEKDVCYIIDDEQFLAASYSTFNDRLVVNASAYVMYSFALCLPYLDLNKRALVEDKIMRLFNFVAHNVQNDGAIYYSPEGDSFIDCFHTCIVLKNIIKTDKIISLPSAKQLVEKCNNYLIKNFKTSSTGLFKRFSITNKPGLIKYDLYDNAEMLNLLVLSGSTQAGTDLFEKIMGHFNDSKGLYSQIDFMNKKINKGTLRWAITPFLLSVSSYLMAEGDS